jgi:hypothetical protein
MIQKLSDSELMQKLRAAVSEERRVLAEVLDYLREVDRRKLFANIGHTSLWDFCVKELGYSDGCAMRRIASMRLLRDLPEVWEELLEGRQTLSSLSQAQQFFRNEEIRDVEEKRAVLAKLEGKSTRECEKELRELSSTPKPTAYKIEISQELHEKLERLQALRSHASKDLEDLLHYLADQALKKLDPEQKPASSPPAPAVNRVTASVRRAVWQRDRGRCVQCGSQSYLEVDHIHPRALGGAHTLENLRLLCRAHNQRAALRAGLTWWRGGRRPAPSGGR